jgi:hypothetical protein
LLGSGDVVHSALDLLPVGTIDVISRFVIIISSVIDLVEDSDSNEIPVTAVDLFEVMTVDSLVTWVGEFTCVSIDLFVVKHPHVTVFTKGDTFPHSSLHESWDDVPAFTLRHVIADSCSHEDLVVEAKDGNFTIATSDLSSKAITVVAHTVASKSPVLTLLVVIEDSSSVVDLVVIGDSPNVTVSTDSDVDHRLTIAQVSPFSTTWGTIWMDSKSHEDSLSIISSPDITITTNIELDHFLCSLWLLNLNPTWVVFLFDVTELFEPDLMSVINAPKDRTVSNRNVHE